MAPGPLARRVLLALALGVAALPSAPGARQAAPVRPNIVVILADDLGYGDLGSYGQPVIRTPRLDRLAAEGVRFTSYYAGAPACTPARAALLTGQYPIRVGLPNVLGPESLTGLPAGVTTLADGLRAAGYRTAIVGKWHLGHARPEHLPTAHGFDRWFGLPYSNDMIPPWVRTTAPLRLYRDASPVDDPVDQPTLTTRYTDEAVAFIREASGGPFFLYLAHSMPHLPLHPSAEFLGRSRGGRYGDVIEMLDASTGRVLDALDAAGVAGRTIVVFTSDNGPWLDLPARMLQDGVEPWHAGSPGPLRGAKATTWEGGVRVPAILRWPGHAKAGLVVAEPAAAMDLYVTLLGAAGAGPAAGQGRDGVDLGPLVAGTGPAPRNEFFYFQGARLEAVRVGPWKLRRRAGAAPELFHLEQDPGERYDLSRHEPARVRTLEGRMTAFEDTLQRGR